MTDPNTDPRLLSPERLTRMREAAQAVVDETTADVDRYERSPFTGPNVAAQLGEIRAAQVALAQMVIALVDDRAARP